MPAPPALEDSSENCSGQRADVKPAFPAAVNLMAASIDGTKSQREKQDDRDDGLAVSKTLLSQEAEPPDNDPDFIELLLDEFTKLHENLIEEVRSKDYRIGQEARARINEQIDDAHTAEIAKLFTGHYELKPHPGQQHPNPLKSRIKEDLRASSPSSRLLSELQTSRLRLQTSEVVQDPIRKDSTLQTSEGILEPSRGSHGEVVDHRRAKIERIQRSFTKGVLENEEIDETPSPAMDSNRFLFSGVPSAGLSQFAQPPILKGKSSSPRKSTARGTASSLLEPSNGNGTRNMQHVPQFALDNVTKKITSPENRDLDQESAYIPSSESSGTPTRSPAQVSSHTPKMSYIENGADDDIPIASPSLEDRAPGELSLLPLSDDETGAESKDAPPNQASAEMNLPYVGYTFKRFDGYRNEAFPGHVDSHPGENLPNEDLSSVVTGRVIPGPRLTKSLESRRNNVSKVKLGKFLADETLGAWADEDSGESAVTVLDRSDLSIIGGLLADWTTVHPARADVLFEATMETPLLYHLTKVPGDLS